VALGLTATVTGVHVPPTIADPATQVVQVGGFVAPFAQGLGAQVLPFQVFPDAQLEVTATESSWTELLYR
jgi:hypothetical protein